VPVWVVVPFFWTFVSTSVSVVVLSCESGSVTVQVSVCIEKSSVSESVSAVHVVVVRFVHTISNISVAIVVQALSGCLRNGSGGDTITDTIITHVLHNQLTIVDALATTVLVSPFHCDFFFIKVVQRTDV